MTSPVVQHLADVLKSAELPEITDVTVNDKGIVTVTFTDQSAMYVRLAHQAPAKASVPSSPSWPGATKATDQGAHTTGGRR